MCTEGTILLKYLKTTDLDTDNFVGFHN